jgi:hypothetical protein
MPNSVSREELPDVCSSPISDRAAKRDVGSLLVARPMRRRRPACRPELFTPHRLSDPGNGGGPQSLCSQHVRRHSRRSRRRPRQTLRRKLRPTVAPLHSDLETDEACPDHDDHAALSPRQPQLGLRPRRGRRTRRVRLRLPHPG